MRDMRDADPPITDTAERGSDEGPPTARDGHEPNYTEGWEAGYGHGYRAGYEAGSSGRPFDDSHRDEAGRIVEDRSEVGAANASDDALNPPARP